jgi:4-hydroxy-3-methylbut-2-enyl diphosphate reductase
VLRVDGPEELPADLAGTVGVIAGASAPEEVVQAVVARLAPRAGVEEVRAVDEDEYFPLPRELRETARNLAAAAAVAGFAPGGDPTAGGAPLPDDRELSASVALAGLTR